MLCLASRSPHAEHRRADHQQDAYQRGAWRVIVLPEEDAGDSNRYANDDEADTLDQFRGRGFHEISFPRLKSKGLIRRNKQEIPGDSDGYNLPPGIIEKHYKPIRLAICTASSSCGAALPSMVN